MQSMRATIVNSMKLEFDSSSCNESFARSTVCAFAAQLDPTLAELTEVRTAVSEAVTNSIIHGYISKPGKKTVTASLYSDRHIRITVRDRGAGIEDINTARLPLYTSDTSGERGGMGFSIMESFTDKMKVVSAPGKGTTVTLIKYFDGE